MDANAPYYYRSGAQGDDTDSAAAANAPIGYETAFTGVLQSECARQRQTSFTGVGHLQENTWQPYAIGPSVPDLNLFQFSDTAPPQQFQEHQTFRRTYQLSAMDSESQRGRQLFDNHQSEDSRPSRSLSSNAREVLSTTQDGGPDHSPLRTSTQNDGSVHQGDETSSILPKRERPRVEPTIEHGKYVCQICKIKPFDRRCEWK